MDKSMTITDMSMAANAMAKSGFFTDTHDAAQAMVKIMAGNEMGFGAFASMTGVYIIQGKPSVGANLMAAAVKASGKYDYHVSTMTDKECSIIFIQAGKEIGTSTFNLEDAKKAGTKNLDKFPRNMLFARAMSNGFRWFTPDIFMGAPVYTPEELGADVNIDGEVIDLPAPLKNTSKWADIDNDGNVLPGERERIAALKQEATDPGDEVTEGTPMPIEMAEAVKNSEGVLYTTIKTDKLAAMANSLAKVLKDNHLDPQDREEKVYKLAAARSILASRQ
jgi:hypothetical protein